MKEKLVAISSIPKEYDLSSRQTKAVKYVEKHGSITNSKYQQLFKVSRATANRELNTLTEKGILLRQGTVGIGTKYTLHPDN